MESNQHEQREKLNELALFAGAGGGIIGGKILGWRTVCAVERDAYAAVVLAQRQNDGLLEAFPIWSDVTTFDGGPWRGIIDVISGGFPCQDISAAGKGAGLDGERSGLWSEFARIIGEVRPRYAFIENSPMLTTRGLDRVLSDLAAMRYDAEWACISTREVGGCHLRERMWVVATNTEKLHSDGGTNNTENSGGEIPEFRNGDSEAYAAHHRSERGKRIIKKQIPRLATFPWGEDVRRIEDLRNRPELPEPLIRRANDGMAYGVDRLKAIGNGQVPICAAVAFNHLIDRVGNGI